MEKSCIIEPDFFKMRNDVHSCDAFTLDFIKEGLWQSIKVQIKQDSENTLGSSSRTVKCHFKLVGLNFRIRLDSSINIRTTQKVSASERKTKRKQITCVRIGLYSMSSIFLMSQRSRLSAFEKFMGRKKERHTSPPASLRKWNLTISGKCSFSVKVGTFLKTAGARSLKAAWKTVW